MQVTSPLVWQQIALGYSLISALLVALLPFLRSFHTGMVMNVDNITSGASGSGSRSGRLRENGYPLQNLSKGSKQQSIASAVPQEGMLIQKTIDWSVHYEETDRP